MTKQALVSELRKAGLEPTEVNPTNITDCVNAALDIHTGHRTYHFTHDGSQRVKYPVSLYRELNVGERDWGKFPYSSSQYGFLVISLCRKLGPDIDILRMPSNQPVAVHNNIIGLF